MDGHFIKNPFAGMDVEEIRCSIDAMEDIRAELNRYVAEVAARNIEGFDVGEFSTYVDAVITDTVDCPINLANGAIEDQS